MRYCKCDLCNKKFRPDDHAVSTIKLQVYDSCHSSWPGGSKFDLCVSCTEKIEKFLKIKE